MKIKIKRVYDAAEAADGERVLVDRLWPRGLKKDEAKIGKWFKEAAPSASLRKWYAHDPDKFQEFSNKYQDELSNARAFNDLLEYLKDFNKVTLLFAAHDEKRNNAAVLKSVIELRLKEQIPDSH